MRSNPRSRWRRWAGRARTCCERSTRVSPGTIYRAICRTWRRTRSRSTGASGAAYVATDGGLFYASVDLEGSSPASNWTLISSSLPAAPAVDVKLDPGGNQLYVALDRIRRVCALRAAPGRATAVVNAADFSARAAAPGSLVSVVGGKVTRAQAGELNFPVLDAYENESQIQVPFEAAAVLRWIDLAGAWNRREGSLRFGSSGAGCFAGHLHRPDVAPRCCSTPTAA